MDGLSLHIELSFKWLLFCSVSLGDVSLGDVVVLSILFALSLMALILVTSALLLFVLRRNRRIKNQINFVKMEDDGL